jgi:hypothetical protein
VTWYDLATILAGSLAVLVWVAAYAITARRWRRLLVRLDRLIWILEALEYELEPPEPAPALFDQDDAGD